MTPPQCGQCGAITDGVRLLRVQADTLTVTVSFCSRGCYMRAAREVSEWIFDPLAHLHEEDAE